MQRTFVACDRIGATLLELLVALPVAAIIGTVAVRLLFDTNKLARRLNSTTEIGRELRQAGAVLAAEIRPLSAADLVSWSDTAIDMQAVVGSGIVCAIPSPTLIDMLPLNGNDALRTSWFATPQAGDNVITTIVDSALVPGAGQWRSTSLHSASTSASSVCGAQPLMANGTNSGGSVIRLTLSVANSDKPPVGSPVRITRRARYSLYKAGDGLWYLGRKSLSPSGWSTVQPVAGPLDKPSLFGLFMQVRDSANNVLPMGAPATPHSVLLMLHSSSAWRKSVSQVGAQDSVLMHVTLRGQMPVVSP